MALGLFALRRRNQVVQGSTSVVRKLGEKPKRIVLAELHLVQESCCQPQGGSTHTLASSSVNSRILIDLMSVSEEKSGLITVETCGGCS